jgi:hypothetical protein
VESVGTFSLTVGREAEDEIEGFKGVDCMSTGFGGMVVASTPGIEEVGCCCVRCDSDTVCSGVRSASSHAVKIADSTFVSMLTRRVSNH